MYEAFSLIAHSKKVNGNLFIDFKGVLVRLLITYTTSQITPTEFKLRICRFPFFLSF